MAANFDWIAYIDGLNAVIPPERSEKFVEAPPECFWQFPDRDLKSLNKLKVGDKIAVTFNDFWSKKKVYHLATVVYVDFIWVGYKVDRSDFTPDWIPCDDPDIAPLNTVFPQSMDAPTGFHGNKQAYIAYVKSVMTKNAKKVAPAEAFDTITVAHRPSSNPFKVGMKFLAYDIKDDFIRPEGIRAVTVVKVNNNDVTLHFDGVQGKQGMWTECYDSRYFYPIGFEKRLEEAGSGTPFIPPTRPELFRHKLIRQCWPDIRVERPRLLSSTPEQPNDYLNESCTSECVIEVPKFGVAKKSIPFTPSPNKKRRFLKLIDKEALAEATGERPGTSNDQKIDEMSNLGSVQAETMSEISSLTIPEFKLRLLSSQDCFVSLNTGQNQAPEVSTPVFQPKKVKRFLDLADKRPSCQMEDEEMSMFGVNTERYGSNTPRNDQDPIVTQTEMHISVPRRGSVQTSGGLEPEEEDELMETENGSDNQEFAQNPESRDNEPQQQQENVEIHENEADSEEATKSDIFKVMKNFYKKLSAEMINLVDENEKLRSENEKLKRQLASTNRETRSSSVVSTSRPSSSRARSRFKARNETPKGYLNQSYHVPDHVKNSDFDISSLEDTHSPTSAENFRPPIEKTKGGDRWEIEKILVASTKDNKTKYYLKWVGWPYSICTWEVAEDLSACSRAVQDFRLREGIREMLRNSIAERESQKFLPFEKKIQGFGDHFLALSRRQCQEWEDEIREVTNKYKLPPLYIENWVDSEGKPWNFKYICKNIVEEDILTTLKNDREEGCECKSCGGVECCPKKNDEYLYYQDGRLLPDIFVHKGPIFECNDRCKCSANCPTRVVQKGRKFALFIFRTKDRGWSIRTCERIPAYSFVTEYIGEVISTDECQRRPITSYQYGLYGGGSVKFYIDAHNYGNEARFINHSCEPNLTAFAAYVDHSDKHPHRIAFFSRRDIKSGEELTCDYYEPINPKSPERKKRRKSSSAQIKCLCNAPSCRGYLG